MSEKEWDIIRTALSMMAGGLMGHIGEMAFVIKHTHSTLHRRAMEAVKVMLQDRLAETEFLLEKLRLDLIERQRQGQH